jgi:hypothetical protein
MMRLMNKPEWAVEEVFVDEPGYTLHDGDRGDYKD